MTKLSFLARATATALTASGVLHLSRPRTFTYLIPRQLPPVTTVKVTGWAELAAGLAVLVPPLRPIGRPLAALVLLGIWPGNMVMAGKSGRTMAFGRARGGVPPLWYRLLSWGRVPLQIPLILAVWRAGR